ncbi:MAG: SulP family inorganic anion transporter [Inquilinus sp.]|uniref:SulP family inorganic anion transporter n=1 Tax=Inquilinus sp. TaxID=1932117 RepID=UPI003F2B3ED9
MDRSRWSYHATDLTGDLSAGVSVAAVAVPVGLAYAAIVGLPPQAGLYSAILPAAADAMFGPSRILVGPDTATCILVGATLTQLGLATIEERTQVAAVLALVVGAFCLVGSAVRLGVVANFLSKPILTGYLVGVAATLFVGQYISLTGVPIGSHGIVAPTVDLLRNLLQIHGPTLAIGLALFVVIRVLKRHAPRFPGPVAVLVLGIGLSWMLELPAAGLPVVGEIPRSLPLPPTTLPPVDWSVLILDALGITVVSFSSGIVTARSFAPQLGQPVDPNRELRGFAAANIAAALTQGFPVTGADSRTAVSISAGGRTRLAALISALALAVMILFLHKPLALLPMAALGAILASAAIDLMDLRGLWRLRAVSRFELLLGVLTAVSVVASGVMNGIMIAMAASFLHLLRLASTPRDALLGVIPGVPGLYKLHRHRDAAPVPGVLIYLFEGSPLFLNAARLKRRALRAVRRFPDPIRWFVLDASVMVELDSTAHDELRALIAELRQQGITFVLAGGHGRFREVVERSGLAREIGPDHVFETAEDAVAALQSEFLAPNGRARPDQPATVRSI